MKNNFIFSQYCDCTIGLFSIAPDKAIALNILFLIFLSKFFFFLITLKGDRS